MELTYSASTLFVSFVKLSAKSTYENTKNAKKLIIAIIANGMSTQIVKQKPKQH